MGAGIQSTLIQEQRIFGNEKTWKNCLQILGASGLIALCSQIKIPLFFTPVPLTLQTLAILLIGAQLGSRKGALAVLLYFAQIFIGLPVLSGGLSDPFVFLGPKGGYVIGFLFQAYIMGTCVENLKLSKPMNVFVGGLLSCTVQMGLGILVLAQFVGWESVWIMGFYPFVLGEILKIIFASTYLSKAS